MLDDARKEKAMWRTLDALKHSKTSSTAQVRGRVHHELWRAGEGHVSREDVTTVTNNVVELLKERGVEVK